MQRFLPPILFIAALFVMVELSVRIYLYGPAAISPMRMDSYTQILDSGMVQAAEDPAINYELKPNLDTWYKGIKFVTNSAGLRGPEVAPDKKANVKRIAVLGASWTMGSGVAAEDIYHAQLGELLNTDGDTRYEVLNFGLDQYSLGQIVATLEQKVPAYDPDLVIIALTYFTPTILWDDPPVPYQVIPTRHPFFDSHALRLLDYRLGTYWFSDDDSRRPTASGKDGSIGEQLDKAFRIMERYSLDSGVPVAVVKMSYQLGWGQRSDVIGARIQPYSDSLNYFVVGGPWAREYGHEKLRVSRWDSHPNAFTHGLIAEAMLEQLKEAQLVD